ncbi:helix-turn-helix transcriptional regulator [Rhizorhabdus dicambivorans]|uniref:helix-turn-helix transcriptional regulator n=1 Tax=Rhizorhabdus dicambivorans TaxID=1850238 RepID=UPI001596BB29|nr:LuxR family transcriptional regulator [Rhizorhabdus dicambivorans]
MARQFTEQARDFACEADLSSALEACARELGFHYFALLHHVDLRNRSTRKVHIDNYPVEWTEHFIQSRLFLEDPILRASLMTSIGFAWESVPNLIKISPRQQRILEEARRQGIGSGFTVPVHIPGEAHGSCSFAAAVGRTFPEKHLLAAQLVGSFAFEAARRICCTRCLSRLQAVHLTPRQHDCLVLVAQGKTDWEIGQILGIKEDSVTKVIDAARRRYDVANRTELVVAALFDGQISFNEVRHWQYPISETANRASRRSP